MFIDKSYFRKVGFLENMMDGLLLEASLFTVFQTTFRASVLPVCDPFSKAENY